MSHTRSGGQEEGLPSWLEVVEAPDSLMRPPEATEQNRRKWSVSCVTGGVTEDPISSLWTSWKRGPVTSAGHLIDCSLKSRQEEVQLSR